MKAAPISSAAGYSAQGRRDQLLKKIQDDAKLPTLGVTIAKVLEITSSNEDSIAKLAHFVLSDVGLTQKILRLSNTVHYRGNVGTPVTTVSRSIFLLGFNTIKTTAMAMLLADCFSSRMQVADVRRELMRALCASIIGREIAQRGRFPDAEEAAVVALFKNISQVLLASFDHELYQSINQTCQQDSLQSASAQQDVINSLLGCSYERLAEQALTVWKMPELIVQSMAPLPAGQQRYSAHRSEWIRQVAAFSDGLAAALVAGQASSPAVLGGLLQRFGRALELEQASLESMLQRVETETRQLAKSLDIAIPEPGAPRVPAFLPDGLPEGILLQDPEFALETERQTYPSGKPLNARDRLLAGVQDVTQMLASGQYRLNDLMLLVLETLYAGMGFRFATICIRDLASGRYMARLAVGEDYNERQRQFNFTVSPGADIFYLALSNNADLMIADAGNFKIRDMLPAWHTKALPDTRSFIVLPLVLQQKPLGLFYADRSVIAEEGVAADETALIKTLKSQLLAAMMRS